MFVFVLLCITLCPFLFCNHLEERKKAGCFAIIVLQMIWYYNVLWLFLTVPWVGLQCAIVVFPDHTHFLFKRFLPSTFENVTHHFRLKLYAANIILTCMFRLLDETLTFCEIKFGHKKIPSP